MIPEGSCNDDDTFQHLWKRLELLERWLEVAIRPSADDCPNDVDLLRHPVDDLTTLQERCLDVRQEMNLHVPYPMTAFDNDLVPSPSTIPGAGVGLFFQGQKAISEGQILCYYAGHIHNYHSAKLLKDVSYLMHVQGDVLVDPKPLPHIKARYINDPLNEDWINVKYVPDDTSGIRSAVVTTRIIRPGEELFASYGDAYWARHQTPGRVKV